MPRLHNYGIIGFPNKHAIITTAFVASIGKTCLQLWSLSFLSFLPQLFLLLLLFSGEKLNASITATLLVVFAFTEGAEYLIFSFYSSLPLEILILFTLRATLVAMFWVVAFVTGPSSEPWQVCLLLSFSGISLSLLMRLVSFFVFLELINPSSHHSIKVS